MSPAPTRIRGISPMYQLQTDKNTSNFLKNPSGQKEKKVGKNLYLKTKHFDFLDHIADSQDISRNQALRNILDELMKDGEGLK